MKELLFFNNVIDLFAMKNINLIRFIVLVTMLTFFLSSCGLRGPLYLPPKTTTKEPSKASDAQKPNQLMSH